MSGYRVLRVIISLLKLVLKIEGEDNLSFPANFTEIVEPVIAGGVDFTFQPSFRLILHTHFVYILPKDVIRIEGEGATKSNLRDGHLDVDITFNVAVHVSLQGDTIREFKNVLDGSWSLDRSRLLRPNNYET